MGPAANNITQDPKRGFIFGLKGQINTKLFSLLAPERIFDSYILPFYYLYVLSTPQFNLPRTQIGILLHNLAILKARKMSFYANVLLW